MAAHVPEVRPKGYRAPSVAGLALMAGLAFWAHLERVGLDQRHHAELRRFVDGALLALDASHDLLRPLSTRPGNPGSIASPRSQAPALRPLPGGLERLEPVLRRMVTAQPRIRWMAITAAGVVVARSGPVPASLPIEGAHGERLTGGLYIGWRPLGAPLSPPPGPGRLPPGAPIAVIAMEARPPAAVMRRDLVQLGQKIGIGALGVAALLLAWVQGIRRRTLQHRLAAEQVRRSHLEELSLAASGLAHETRNPLGIIRGLAQRLGQRHDLAEEARAAADQILEEADRAVSRLGESMSYARVREPTPEKLDARAMLDKACAVLAADIQSAGVDVVVVADPVMIVADPDMLLQTLLNLMLNSLEASRPGSVLTLRLVARGGRATLGVADQGRGIDPDLQERLFKPYVTGRADGHGLGLAIVKRMADHHGWGVRVSSQLGHGTVVEIEGIRTATGEVT